MRPFKLLLAAVTLLVAAHAQAEPYSQHAFDSLLKNGSPALVEVHADWCPTCQQQRPIIQTLLKQEPYRRITVLEVDFDTQKDLLKTLHVSKQSTLIVYKNGKEVGRSMGDTSRSGIERLLEKAI